MAFGFILFAEHNSQAWKYRWAKQYDGSIWSLMAMHANREHYKEEAKIYHNIAANMFNKSVKNRKKRRNINVQEFNDNDFDIK